MTLRARTAAPRRLLFLTLLAATAASGCDAFGGSDPAVLTGKVVNAATNRPLVGATVQVLTMGIEQQSDSSGAYRAELKVDSTRTLRVVAFKTGYAPDTLTVTAEPGQALSVPDLSLRPSAAGDGTSGPAASITLAPRSSQAVGVTGTGSVETAQLVFIAYDANGKPVDAAHAVDIAVSIIQGPGGGEFLSPAAPATVRTNEDGEATVTLTSGTRAGVVQIETRATVGGRQVRSQPVTLVVHGGFPDQAHFTVSSAKKNFAGAAINGLTNAITALVGDEHGNPVQPGTQVYFTTTGGVIGGASATGADGQASVTLMSGNPQPPGSLATVTARSSGTNGVAVETSTQVLFSGIPKIVLETPGQNLGAYTYTVSDGAGFPLAEGTSITVTVEGENVEAKGNVSVSLQDRVAPGAGTTRFQFSVRATDPAEPWSIDEIKIQVAGPNGTATGTRPGSLRPGASVAGRAPVVASRR